MLNNQDIRKRSKEKKVPLWQVAKVMNISDPTMTRMLREELPQTEKEKFFKIIDELAQKQLRFN